MSSYMNFYQFILYIIFHTIERYNYSEATILKVLTNTWKVGTNGYIYFLCVKIQQFPSALKHLRNLGRRV